MQSEAERIAAGLLPSERKALLTKDGAGDFSSSTFVRLTDKGLIEQSLWFTALGNQVREVLMRSPVR